MEASSVTPDPDFEREEAPAVSAETLAPVIICPNCPQGPTARRYQSMEALALHRRQGHGIAFPPEVRKAIDDRRAAGGSVSAAMAPDATRVPAAGVGLPWVRWPEDPHICESIVGRIDVVAGEAMSEAERRFWQSVRSVAMTIAERGGAS